MTTPRRVTATATTVLTPLYALAAICAIDPPAFSQPAPSDNLLKNSSFELGSDDRGVPEQWQLYGALDERRQIRTVTTARVGDGAVLIHDDDPASEVGLSQTVPAEPAECYEAAAWVQRAGEASPAGSYLQLRFLPSNKLVQRALRAAGPDRFNRIPVKAVAPDDTTHARIYLYTHRTPTPKVVIDDVSLISGVEPPPPPPPEPVPPVYDKLKDLHLRTHIAKDGQPNCTIVTPASGVYDELAARIQTKISRLCGVEIPIALDDTSAAEVPVRSNLILLGNRSTNRAIERLYNRFYCMVDLKYPGTGGHVLRTLHNPFGNGHNVVFVSGSDAGGVARATDVFVQTLDQADHDTGSLSVGRIMDVQLGGGLEPAKDVRDMKIWDASAGYGSVGYFGWCSISKHMAAYYMTGDQHHAREFLRLAFPDEAAKQQIADIDGERIENKDDPLAGFYHYNAHMAILLWELIEESPAFSDEQRLRVTNAFSRQLNHRKGEGIYRLARPPAHVGSRHGQWAAISIYCLGRYFNKDYPNPIWQQCMRGPQMHFAPLAEHAWVSGENDNLFWYNTATAPILTWMLLSGDRKPLESGSLHKLLRAQEILISGRQPDWALNSASLTYLNKAAYLTGDGRWINYRRRTGVDTDAFRLGQSFWPSADIQPHPPHDLTHKWTINHLPEPAWLARGTGFEPEESFYFASYRTAPDDSGDFMLMDGFNGASRNPYHTLAILELRLAGHTALQGYRNQVLTRSGGLMEDAVAMNARLQHADALGDAACFIADVPNASFCNWRRRIISRNHRYALVIDELDLDNDADELEVQTLWETTNCHWDSDRNSLVVRPDVGSTVPPGWRGIRALDCEHNTSIADPEGVARLSGLNIVLLRCTQPGEWLDIHFQLDEPFEGRVFVRMLKYKDRGKVAVSLDGNTEVPEYDAYADGVVEDWLPLATQRLEAAEHTLRLTVVGKHGDLEKAYVGVRGLLLKPAGAAEETPVQRFRIIPADAAKADVRGKTARTEVRLRDRAGERHRLFSLIAPEHDPADPLACNRLTGNCAALALPAPAVAIAGDYDRTTADTCILAADHLYAHNLRSAGLGQQLAAADGPIDFDWDFAAADLAVIASQPTRITLTARLDEADAPNAEGVQIQPAEGDTISIIVPPGRHEISGITPPPEALSELRERLRALLAEAESEPAPTPAERAAAPEPPAPQPTIVLQREVGDRVADIITIPSDSGPLLCAAAANRVHIIAPDDTQLHELHTDGDIRTLHWWPEHDLLLVGCKDEKLVAFDRHGEKQWEFVSKMDPAVFRAAKTYWFKSAGPAHAGVHAITTGEFLNGETQAFVGSACTLEILDHEGKLLHRMPVFWGPGHEFALVDAPDGTINLLIAREPTDSEALAIVNNEKLARTGSGFHTVPPGHTYVGSWAQMTRDHIFHQDINADGQNEIVSEINGVWNRVTIWDMTGKALHSVNFGPGRRIPARNIRDLDITDFNADGQKEIIAATSSGIVVALDNTCSRLWSRQLASPPIVLQAVVPGAGRPPLVFVGCEDAAILALDEQGRTVRTGQLPATPCRIGKARFPQYGQCVFVGTTNGHVTVLAP